MIELTEDMRKVNRILMSDSIWPGIAPIDTPPFEAERIDGALYFLANHGDAVIIYHPFRDGLKIHPNFPPERRGKLAFKAIEESIQDIFRFGYKTIYAEIEETLRHVRYAAINLKFNLIEKGDRYLYVRRRLNA